MKEITTIKCVHVISEPGDATRYDYAMHQLGDMVSIMPIGNTFRYPQMINRYAAKKALIEEDRVTAIAEEWKCNPHTVREVCRSIVGIYGDM